LTPRTVEADRRDEVREFNMVEKVVLSSPLTKKKTFKKDRKKNKKKKRKKKRLRSRLERIKANKRRCNSSSNVISSSYYFSNTIVIYSSLTIHVSNKQTIPTNYTGPWLNFVTALIIHRHYYLDMFLWAIIIANVVTCIQLINLQTINVSPLSV